MNSGAFKSSVGRCAFFGKFSILVLTLGLGLMPMGTRAAASNAQFDQYVSSICNGTFPGGPTYPSTWNVTSLCLIQGGAASGGGVGISVNLGITNAGNGGLTSHKQHGVRDEEEQKKLSEKGASADGGAWGFLVSPQFGQNTRKETDLENGYRSTLSGLLVGVDYRFTDGFVLGVTIGHTKDDAKFLFDAGSLNTSSNTFTMYSTWMPSDKIAVDGYLGYGKLNFDSQRYVDLLYLNGTITGIVNGSFAGKQVLAGLSVNTQRDAGRFTISPFINLDYVKTSFDSYNESGSTFSTNLVAMHYGERRVSSLTSSLGGVLNTSYGYEWGALQPSIRLAAVHEFQNRVRIIDNELVATPGYSFPVETDAPDRNYLNLGAGVVTTLNSGAQLYLDYDKRAQDKLLSSWAVSLGVLSEF